MDVTDNSKKGEWYGVYIVYGMCEELSGGCVVIEKVFLSFFKKSTNLEVRVRKSEIPLRY